MWLPSPPPQLRPFSACKKVWDAAVSWAELQLKETFCHCNWTKFWAAIHRFALSDRTRPAQPNRGLRISWARPGVSHPTLGYQTPPAICSGYISCKRQYLFYNSIDTFWQLERKGYIAIWRIPENEVFLLWSWWGIQIKPSQLSVAPCSIISVPCTTQGKHPPNCTGVFFRIQFNVLPLWQI